MNVARDQRRRRFCEDQGQDLRRLIPVCVRPEKGWQAAMNRSRRKIHEQESIGCR